uniref:Lipase_3 domain-containing protein n=1 Tax=Caenorhabditis tropicalis TaxID=1561998 RepID=A0A1I7T5H6_9PELO
MDQAFNDSQVKRQITVQCDTVDDTCSGFTAVSHEDKAVLVVFRGSTSDEQLVVEGLETVFASKKSWISGGTVSEYFNDAFYKIWSAGMKDDVNSLVAKYPEYQVWVTGHSLGGSLASLAATYISFINIIPSHQILLVTFGQPRTGTLNFTESVDRLVPNAYRITHSHDPIPHLPGKGHHGYFHHKSEVYYNEKMSGWEICEEDEGQKCSNSNSFDLDFEDHLHYFNLDILKLGYSNCQNTSIIN